jgi:hypothetical protein
MNRQAYGGRSRSSLIVVFTVFGTLLTGVLPFADGSEWVTRDKRWYIRGPSNWAVPRELPQLFYEFNALTSATPTLPKRCSAPRTNSRSSGRAWKCLTSFSARPLCRQTKSRWHRPSSA